MKTIERAQQKVESGKVSLASALDTLNANASMTALQVSASSTELANAASSLESAQSKLDEAKDTAHDSADLNKVLSKDTITSLLAAQNFDMPAGYAMDGDTEYLVRVGDAVQDVSELKDLPLVDMGIDGIDTIRLSDVAEIKVTDYRENTTYCGYVRCILGKCKVTDMMSQLSEITAQIKDYNSTILQLTNQVAELATKVNEMTGDVVSVGKCGADINYVLYSDGRLILKGTGAMYDYVGAYETSGNKSPFCENDNITSVVVSEGITTVGEYAFQYCNNLKIAALPTTLKTIKRNSFIPHIDEYLVHQNLYGLTEITIPSKVTEIAKFAFSGTAIKSLTIPASVTTVGEQAFGECQKLETVRYSGKVIGDRMFVRCIKLKNFTITKSTTELIGGCFNYCESLTQITYEGSLAEWNAVKKNTNWDGHSSSTVDSPLVKIQCLDGYMEYDADTETWKEVKA